MPVLISRGNVSVFELRLDLDGLPVLYSGEPRPPHQGLGRWIEARVRDAGTSAEAGR